MRVLRESELQKTQLLRDKQKNGHQEADGERRMGGKQGDREQRGQGGYDMKCPPDLAQDVTRDLGATLEWVKVSKSEEVET